MENSRPIVISVLRQENPILNVLDRQTKLIGCHSNIDFWVEWFMSSSCHLLPRTETRQPPYSSLVAKEQEDHMGFGSKTRKTMPASPSEAGETAHIVQLAQGSS